VSQREPKTSSAASSVVALSAADRKARPKQQVVDGLVDVTRTQGGRGRWAAVERDTKYGMFADDGGGVEKQQGLNSSAVVDDWMWGLLGGEREGGGGGVNIRVQGHIQYGIG
jgi:hypothetical protein